MLKFSAYLIILSSIAILTGCGGSDAAQMREVVWQDKHKNEKGEVVITDADFTSGKRQNAENKSKIEPLRLLADGSELVTMFDRYGNKIERRYFRNHPRLQLVMVRTATNGGKQIFVYGFEDEIVTMTEDFAKTALNLPADEIANVAGLKATRPYKPLTPVSTPTHNLPQIASDRNLPTVKPEATINPEIQNTSEAAETENPADENTNSRPDGQNQP